MRASIMRPRHFGQRGRSIGSSDGSERVKASGMGCAAGSGGSTTLSVAAGSRGTALILEQYSKPTVAYVQKSTQDEFAY
jgi:hypothetical protein